MNTSKAASAMGKKSAEINKQRGRDSQYFRDLVKKRWAKRDKKDDNKD